MAAPALAQSTPAPAADGSIMVAGDQNGQSLDVRVGADVSLQLQRNVSGGTRWVVTSKPDFLGDPRQAEMAPALGRPVLGAPSWQLFIFPVSETGSGALTLEKHDRAGATLETFTVTITAQ
jgi:hypothetical protein